MANLMSKTLVSGLIISGFLGFSGCVQRGFNAEEESGISERVAGEPKSPTSETVQKWIDKAPGVLLVANLSDNTMTKYLAGTKVKSWPIMTGDTDGGQHGGDKKYTPTGVFEVHAVDFCPVYKTKNIKGCTSGNPFGKYNMRFHIQDLYGAHGTNLDNQKFYAWDEDDRRVSGGCIRNPSNEIYEAVHDVLKAANPAWEAELTEMSPRAASGTSLKRWNLSSSAPVEKSSFIIVRW